MFRICIGTQTDHTKWATSRTKRPTRTLNIHEWLPVLHTSICFGLIRINYLTTLTMMTEILKPINAFFLSHFIILVLRLNLYNFCFYSCEHFGYHLYQAPTEWQHHQARRETKHRLGIHKIPWHQHEYGFYWFISICINPLYKTFLAAKIRLISCLWHQFIGYGTNKPYSPLRQL